MSDASIAAGRPVVTGGDQTATPAVGKTAGKVLAALVVGHDRSGAAILLTGEGRVTFASPSPLTVGTRLTLLARADGSMRELAARPAQSSPPNVLDGDLFRLVGIDTTSAKLPLLPAGTVLRAEILHQILQQHTGLFARPEGPLADLRPGDILVLRVHGAAAPEGTARTAVPLPLDLVAKVTGEGVAFRLSSPLGTLQLAGNALPETGTALDLRLVTAEAGRAPSAQAAAGSATSAPVLAKAWPALAMIMDDLASAEPTIAAVVRRDVPQPGEGFVGRVLSFVLGLAGDARDSAATLFPQLSTHPDTKPVVDRLADDLQRYGRWAEPGSEWRTFVVPVADGEHLIPFHLYVRDQEERSPAEAAEAGIRFMVDVDLSRLGAIQIDGLYRRRHLSLAIRTRRGLPKSFTDPLKEIFDRALLAAGMTGELRTDTDTVLSRAPLNSVLGRQSPIAV